MFIPQSLARFLPLIVMLALIAIVVAGILLVMYVLPYFTFSSDDVRIETTFIQYSAAAETYKARLTDYDGLCSAIGLPPEVDCAASGNTFVFQQRLEEPGYYCTDSTGFMGVTYVSRGQSPLCIQ